MSIPHTKFYRGHAGARGQVSVCEITHGLGPGRDPRPLQLRFDLLQHSEEFSWGGGVGSGGLQLSLALVADATGDDALSLKIHRGFALLFIARLPAGEAWVVSDNVIGAIAFLVDPTDAEAVARGAAN